MGLPPKANARPIVGTDRVSPVRVSCPSRMLACAPPLVPPERPPLLTAGSQPGTDTPAVFDEVRKIFCRKKTGFRVFLGNSDQIYGAPPNQVALCLMFPIRPQESRRGSPVYSDSKNPPQRIATRFYGKKGGRSEI